MELRQGRDPGVLTIHWGRLHKQDEPWKRLLRLCWILIGCYNAAGDFKSVENQARKKMGRQHQPSRSALPGAWEHFRGGWKSAWGEDLSLTRLRYSQISWYVCIRSDLLSSAITETENICDLNKRDVYFSLVILGPTWFLQGSGTHATILLISAFQRVVPLPLAQDGWPLCLSLTQGVGKKKGRKHTPSL